jgi:hypothetical protein
MSGLILGDTELPDAKNLSEAEMMRVLGAFVPFVSFFVRERFDIPIISIGARVTGFLTLLLIASIALSRGDVLFYSLLFLLVLSFVSIAIHLAFKLDPVYLNLARYIPSLDTSMSFIRSLPSYCVDLV